MRSLSLDDFRYNSWGPVFCSISVPIITGRKTQEISKSPIIPYLTFEPESMKTILSKTFDALRRSWHLKVDIEKLGNKVSLWIVERGEPED